MSFNQTVKEEIFKNSHLKRCCFRAVFSAMLSAQSGVSVCGDSIGFALKSKSRAKREFLTKLAECFDGYDLKISTVSKSSKKEECFLSVPDAKPLLIELGLINYSDGLLNIVEGIPDSVKKECCAKSYLKGLFLENGAIKNPSEKGYHFEITFGGVGAALDCVGLFEELGYTARLTGRKGLSVVYFKDSQAICDVLAMFGASKAVLEINSSLVNNSIRANANRRANCDNANIDKSLAASEKQINAIKRALAESIELPKNLSDIARVRLENPEAPLSEIASLLNISKSGASHRLNRIVEYVARAGKA